MLTIQHSQMNVEDHKYMSLHLGFKSACPFDFGGHIIILMPYARSQVLLWKFPFQNPCNIYANMHIKRIFIHCDWLDIIPIFYHVIRQNPVDLDDEIPELKLRMQ